MTPAPEKAAPIPTDETATFLEWWKASGRAKQYDHWQAEQAAYAAWCERSRADRASQEGRIREDEREAIIDLIASWPEIGGYTGDLRQSILSTVLNRDADIIQAIRERGVMSVAIPTEVLELAMDAEVAIRNEDDHPTDIIARAIMQDRADRASQEADGWQPIETAPKDGSEIILHDRGTVGTGFYSEAAEARRGEAGWFWEDDRGNLVIAKNADPTHWMPLPAPPQDHREG